MDEKQMLAEAQGLVEKAKAILAQGDAAPAEDKANVEKLLNGAKEIKGRVMQMRDILTLGADLVAATKAEPQAPTVAKWANLGEFYRAVYAVKAENQRDPRLKAFRDLAAGDSKAMAENTGAAGGFLVPDEFNTTIQGAIGEGSVIRPLATIIPMRRASMKIPVMDQTGGASGTPAWFGGMHGHWLEEAGQKSESSPTFRQMNLVAHKFAGITYTSDELLDDSAVSLEAFLNGPMGFVGMVNWYEEWAFYRGTGAGQPLGLLNAGATITQARIATSPTVQYGDLVAMYAHLLPGARGHWFINVAHRETLLTMSGPSGNASYLWGNASTGMPDMLLGMPVTWTEKLPAPGSAGDVLLADFRYYVIGDRQATTIETDKSNRFEYDQSTWRIVHRVDGQPWFSTYITLADGSTTVSPFVILGAKTT